MLIKLAWHSLMHRRGSVLLAILSVAVSLMVLLGVDQVRGHAKTSFNRTVSGVDLIVGARTGPLNLLLYSVFRIGSPSNNISWQSYREIANHPRVAWSVPLSLGDSHRGYRVVGTSQAFFSRYRYGQQRPLRFADGEGFADEHQVVLGSELARQFGYRPGDSLVLAHGIGHTSFQHHDAHPFAVIGILEPTGTPVDSALYVSLEGLEAMHGEESDRDHRGHAPESITAFLVGLDSRAAAFQVQRQINDYGGEPLLAILPGAVLAELWRLLGAVEKILLLISALVMLASLLGICILLVTAMRERRREIALLRAIGAGPTSLFLLIQLEALLVLLLGAAVAFIGLTAGLWLAEPQLAERYGIYLSGITAGQALPLMGGILAGTLVLGAFPALGTCRQSLG